MASPTRPPPPPPLRAPDDEPDAPDVEQEDAVHPATPRGPAIPSAIDVSHVGERRVIRRTEIPHPAPDPDHLDIIDEDRPLP